MNGPSYEIMPLRREHVSQAVALHLKAFPGFFLSFLGPSFLTEFYRGFPEQTDALAFVAKNKNGELLGVIVGTSTPIGFFRRLLRRRWWAFCLASAKAIIRRPSVARRLLKAVRYRGDPVDDKPRALLSSIAVSPQSQGQGVGHALLLAWMNAARLRGSTGCYLTTDAINNDAVNKFYQRNGWGLIASFKTPEGRQMNRYVWDFSSISNGDITV